VLISIKQDYSICKSIDSITVFEDISLRILMFKKLHCNFINKSNNLLRLTS